MALRMKMLIAQEPLKEQINCKGRLQGADLADQRELMEAWRIFDS